MPEKHNFCRDRSQPGIALLIMTAIALAPILSPVSCSDTPNNPSAGNHQTSEPDTSAISEGKFLFDRTYINFAWGYTLRGAYIDNYGDMYTYEYPESASPWTPVDFDFPTEAELMAKFGSSPTLIGRVDRDQLRRMHSLIPAAEQGTLSDPVHVCADAGGTSYVAYVYLPETQTYKAVLLYLAGVYAQKNTSREADRLYHSMREAFGTTGPEACGYPEE